MSSEIEVPETPNWLKDLEAKREKRLKAKLGHETGAGAPCLKCADKCPGLDLHFWRKCCKICRCSKEEHEVQDDDIYGWAQFQLLGNKPSRAKRKIVLPGKHELELEWAPKGDNDIVDKYLKTLAPEQLPIKGSQAAQNRKQLLQKQIPIHDIDPTLCHELSEDEFNKMNEYITHVKKSSVGVGQIVSLTNVIGNLHIFNPNDAELIASQYPKSIPLSEVVKLQAASKVDPLKQHNLTQNMHNLSVEDRYVKNLSPNNLFPCKETMSPITMSKIHDRNYLSSINEETQTSHHPQISNILFKKPLIMDNSISNISNLNDCRYYEEIDKIHRKMNPATFENRYLQKPYNTSKDIFITTENNNNKFGADSNMSKLPQNPNFNSKNLPSQFINQYLPHEMSVLTGIVQQDPYEKIVPFSDISEQFNKSSGSAFVPYSKNNTHISIGDPYSNESHCLRPNSDPNNLARIGIQTHSSHATGDDKRNAVTQFRNKSEQISNYISGKYNPLSEVQTPTFIPQNVRDLAFSTYDSESHSNTKADEIISDTLHNLPETCGMQRTEYISSPLRLATYDEENLKSIPNYSLKIQDTCISKGFPGMPKNMSHDSLGMSLDSSYSNFSKQNLHDPQRQFVPVEHDISCLKPKLQISLQPGKLSVREDFMEPSHISIGAIQDINYPEIKAAVQGTNDFYEDYSPDSIKEVLNNVKFPDCHYCKKPFEEKEFAITIERANVLFHADCFRCAGCNQILADNFYFFSKENNNIYCGRDYAKIRGFPRCKACDELIFTKEYCLAEENTFHLKHFCCTECDVPLAGQDYTVDDCDGMPFCLPCYERIKADSCNTCNKVIKPEERGCTLNGVHFHADNQCFSCKICNTPLMGKKLLLRKNNLYCSHNCYGTDQ